MSHLWREKGLLPMLPAAIAQDVYYFLHLLHERYGTALVSVVLFGSWARGTARAESDIDLLVINTHLPQSRLDRHQGLFEAAQAVTPEFAARVSVIPLTPEEARIAKPFYLGMLTAHVMLYDHAGFFAALLQRLQARLVTLGSERRVDQNGYEYWILKPDLKPGEAVEL